ncbi:hypothetical protein NKR19_g8973 [Coniochaeta hoffmannii]|uniref:Uncharacterized protein n=1 Tax=Coniochaeta hoffmannii TaxID=91930 RepID=A0AA38VE42_9PEZI|nr:hypothetical protein NKR19_g8973 [Coniochaeta hoffmannii]
MVEGMRFGYDHVPPNTAIANWLEQHKLDIWGFVIIRRTYAFQEKLDKFLALAKQDAREWLEQHGSEYHATLYDKLAWTVIEDPQTLEGPSILDTSHKFQALARHQRYRYFVHVDEESLESVVDDEKARDENAGYFCKVVFPDSVMIREQPRAAGEIPDPQDPLDEQLELLDCVKKIRFGHLVSLYRVTLDPNIWCYFQVEVDYDHVGIAVF